MRSSYLGIALAGAVAVSASGVYADPTGAAASVYSYDLFKSAVHSQFSNDPPGDPDYFIGVARLIMSSPMDVNPVTLNYAGVYNGGGLLTFDNSQYLFFGTPRATQAVLDADFPTGTYTYTIYSAFPFQQSATLQVTTTALTPTVPAFTGDTHDRLQGMNSAQDFSAEINGWLPGPNANEWYTFLDVRDVNTGETRYATGALDPATTEVVIPAGALASNTMYQVSVYYSTRNNQSPGGFNDALRLCAWDRITSVIFTTAAPSCVLDYNGDTVLNPDDLGDFITDYFTEPAIPGPEGYAIACPENEAPYDQGYKAAYTPDGSGQCIPPFSDNLGDWITDYFGSEGCPA